MARRRSSPRRGASEEAAATTPPGVLADGVPSLFVQAQQQGVPAGVHPPGAAVLRSFQELQRLAEADGAPDPRREVRQQLGRPARPGLSAVGLASPWTILDSNQ